MLRLLERKPAADYKSLYSCHFVHRAFKAVGVDQLGVYDRSRETESLMRAHKTTVTGGAITASFTA